MVLPWLYCSLPREIIIRNPPARIMAGKITYKRMVKAKARRFAVVSTASQSPQAVPVQDRRGFPQYPPLKIASMESFACAKKGRATKARRSATNKKRFIVLG
jgi:hypothetical protein